MAVRKCVEECAVDLFSFDDGLDRREVVSVEGRKERSAEYLGPVGAASFEFSMCEKSMSLLPWVRL